MPDLNDYLMFEVANVFANQRKKSDAVKALAEFKTDGKSNDSNAELDAGVTKRNKTITGQKP